jgi:two-component system, OmpR family, sensor kinase
VAIPLNGVDERLDRLLLVEGLVIGGVLVLLALLSWFLVRAGLRPLERIGQTADAIAAGDLSRRVDVATPKTEVGRLGLAFNAMLARLEEAFRQREASEGRLRRFLADVSHELRTPLASIRGYSEVFRIGAARRPGEVDRAMTRIEEEATRMGVLVEDLLTLARLDEVRDRSVEAVDLSQLAEDAAADARAVDSTRAIEVDGDGDAIVLGDPNQLRQVLANLMRNALVHTPAGTPIELTTRRNGRRVELEVRDHGPGLPTDNPEELWERFWRAEPGRERGRAGAGLGLAIVAGIVRAHDGTVQAENAAGGGASFVVRLPLAG